MSLMVVVTGGAGFIGSNLVHALVARGHEVAVVDDLADASKFSNLVGADIIDYLDRNEFLATLARDDTWSGRIDAIVHQGAITDTTHPDGRLVMRLNYEYGKRLIEQCQARKIRLVYASSAAVYGSRSEPGEGSGRERPLNVYGFSKLLIDRLVQRQLASACRQIVGLRYFNVYGPRERHKGRMASLVHQLYLQLVQGGRVRLFGDSHGVGPGEQRRDFVFVDDVVDANCFFLDHPELSGVFDVGTGTSRSFNELAQAVLAFHGSGAIEYVPFPPELVPQYQAFTRADITALRAAGHPVSFIPLEEGVPRTLQWLKQQLSFAT